MIYIIYSPFIFENKMSSRNQFCQEIRYEYGCNCNQHPVIKQTIQYYKYYKYEKLLKC